MEIKEKIKEVIQKISLNIPEVKEVMVLTEDGFIIESLTQQTEKLELISPDISNALRSMKILTQETIKSDPEEVLITTPQGHFIIYHKNDIILALWADKSANLGLLRTVSKRVLPTLEQSLFV